MGNISTSSIFGKHDSVFDDSENNKDKNNNKLFTLPFSEQDVLALQATFVSLGIHTIKTKNIIDGRKIIETILKSLNYYHNVGCVTDVEQVPDTACDIVNHIKLQAVNQNNLLLDLEDFFAVHPCFDFIWIEMTESMQNNFSIEDIKNTFNMYHVEERMPVLIMIYDEK